MPYSGLRFNYNDLLEDIRNIREIAAPFIREDAGHVLFEFEKTVKMVRNAQAEILVPISISTKQPIVTKSTDRYRQGKRGGGAQVFGTLCCLWEIVNPDPGRKTQDHFILQGVASTSICIYRDDNDECIAQWQFEVGDSDSPGSHFHTAANQYEKTGLFPEWLKVPRFSGLIFWPMDAFEFLLGEIFQLDWVKAVSRESHHKKAWSGSQSHRLSEVLKWQLDQVSQPMTTPWMTVKQAKPPLDLMFGD